VGFPARLGLAWPANHSCAMFRVTGTIEGSEEVVDLCFVSTLSDSDGRKEKERRTDGASRLPVQLRASPQIHKDIACPLIVPRSTSPPTVAAPHASNPRNSSATLSHHRYSSISGEQHSRLHSRARPIAMCFGKKSRPASAGDGTDGPRLRSAPTGLPPPPYTSPQDRSLVSEYTQQQPPPPPPLMDDGKADPFVGGTAQFQPSYPQHPSYSHQQPPYFQQPAYPLQPAHNTGAISEIPGSFRTLPCTDPYATLRRFDTVFLIDDSGSMHGSNWSQTASALASIVPICTEYDSDGVDIHFLNSPTSQQHVRNADEVYQLFSRVSPHGATPTGYRLGTLLDHYMYAFRANRNIKPMNIICITDGEPTDPTTLERNIVRVARELDQLKAKERQVGVQFFQVGDDHAATQALEELDNCLVEEHGVRDMVDTVSWKDLHGGLTGEGILKAVMGAIDGGLDRKRKLR